MAARSLPLVLAVALAACGPDDVAPVDGDAALRADAGPVALVDGGTEGSTGDAAPEPTPVDAAPADAAGDIEPTPDPEAPPEPEPDPEPVPDPEPEPQPEPEPEPPPAARPDAPGPYELETAEVQVDLGPRDDLPDAVPVTVYRPVGPGPYPLVIFSHGFSLPPSGYADYARRLAGHGLLTMTPRYDDSPFAPRSHLGLMRDTLGVIDWALDDSPWADVLDGSIGLVGHSRGGKQSIHAALFDDRVRAVLGLDPVDSAPPFSDPAANPSVTPELVGDLRIPSAFVGSGLGGRGLQPCAPPADNYDAYYRAAAPPTARYLIAEAGHQDFVDTCAAGAFELACNICPSGGIAAEVHAFSVTLTTAFMGLHLAGEAGFAPWVDGAELARQPFVDRQARE